MDKMKLHTPNLIDKNIAWIREIFPGCVTETFGQNGEVRLAVDFDQLRQELSSHIIEGPQERYHLNWPGKNKSLIVANSPITKTLRPVRDESVNFDTTQNLFIEGDNLEALKLLQETYLGEIGLIYIDPPYNTGSDLIYQDDFSESTEEFLRRSNQIDEHGNRLVANTEANGRFHSCWLSMMYPRLKLARNLLRPDGAIFISIDDEEQENLKKLCDEVFGSENFINTISINMKNVAGASGGGEDKRIKKNIEFLHVYVRDHSEFLGFESVYEYVPIIDLVEKYRKEDRSWKYTSVLVIPGEKVFVGSTPDGDGNDINIFERKGFQIKSISQLSREDGIDESDVYSKYADMIFQTEMPQSSIRPRVMKKVDGLGGPNSDLYSIEYTPRSGRNKGKLYEQFYKGNSFRLVAWLKDVSEKIDGTLYKKEMQGTYWDFVGETKNLTREGDIPFQNGKKPIAMLQRILSMQKCKNITVLDFFAGSASTAHAILAQNAIDGGNHRFIMVQIPEECNKKSDAFKMGIQNVSDLGKERIRRAGAKILKGECHREWNKDVGFRVLKIDTSNMRDNYYTPDQTNQQSLLDAVDNIKPGRTPQDLLFQVLVDWGVDLTLPIRHEKIQGKNVFFVDKNALIACFDMEITENLVKEIVKYKPLRILFYDSGFISDALKINVEQIFQQHSPITDVKSI